MGLFSIRGNDLAEVQRHVGFPAVKNQGKFEEIMREPGFKQLYDEILASTDSVVTVFKLNKTIKSDGRKRVAGDFCGIVAHMPDGGYQVCLPIREHALDLSAFAVQSIEADEVATDPYAYAAFGGRLAVATAIQVELGFTKPHQD